MNKYLNKLDVSISRKLGDATKKISIEGDLLECKGILVYQQHSMLLLLMYDQNIRIDFSTIISYNVCDNSFAEVSSYGSTATSITTTDNGSLIGRAVLGGIVGGSAGSIIGASSAKRKTETNFSERFTKNNTTHNYTLYINVNSFEDPVVEINFGQDENALNEMIAILNIILNKSLEKTVVKSYDEKIEALDTYHIIEQKYQQQDRIAEIQKIEAKRKMVENEYEKYKAENACFSKNPLRIVKEFISLGHLLCLLSIPLGLAATLTYNNGWWMISTYILFVLAVAIPYCIGWCLMPSSKKEQINCQSFDEGYLKGIAVIILIISTFPFFLYSTDFILFVYNKIGIFYGAYEGIGMVYYVLLFILGIIKIIFTKNFFYFRKPQDIIDYVLRKRFNWGMVTGILFSIFTFIFTIFIGWCIFSHNIVDIENDIL